MPPKRHPGGAKYVCGCTGSQGGFIRFCPVHAAAFELLDACNAVDIYFKAMCEQWWANDGRVVSESGKVIKGCAEIQALCEVAAQKVLRVLQKATGTSTGL